MMQNFILAIPLIVLLFVIVLLFYAKNQIEFKEIKIEINDLPKSLTNFSIIHISDFHCGIPTSGKTLEKAIKLINKYCPNPDLIVNTGDTIDLTWNQARNALPVLKSLKAKQGFWSILGNHDHIEPGASEKLKEFYQAINAKILVDSHEIIQINESTQIAIIGIDYHEFGQENFKERIESSLANFKENSQKYTLKILLSHDPVGFDYAEPFGIKLTLSGHTHGGQILNIQPRKIFKYLSGHFKRNNGSLYVNKGIGHAFFFPFRAFCPAEITKIVLVNK